MNDGNKLINTSLAIIRQLATPSDARARVIPHSNALAYIYQIFFSHIHHVFLYTGAPYGERHYKKVKNRKVRVSCKFTVPYASTWATKIDINSV